MIVKRDKSIVICGYINTTFRSNHIQMHYRTNLPNLYQHLIAMS